MYFAEICINSSAKNLDKLFTYSLTEEFIDLQPGHRVIVSFGGRKAEGFILEKHNDPTRLSVDAATIKPILDIVDADPWFTPDMIALAKNISKYYLCTLSDALQLFIVGSSGVSSEYYYSLAHEFDTMDLTKLNEQQILVLNTIKAEKKVTYNKLQNIIKTSIKLHSILIFLLNQKLVQRIQHIEKRFKEKTEVYIELNTQSPLPVISKRAIKQLQLIDILQQNKQLLLAEALLTGISRSVIKNMEKAGLIVLKHIRIYRSSYEQQTNVQTPLLTLTPQQNLVVESFTNNLQLPQPRNFLIHGITGSGKTEIYLRMCKQVLEQGKQVLLLVPEIALTGQIVKKFQDFFTTKVTVSHSRLSTNERMDVYNQIHDGQVHILIGARSAVFAPFKNLGLIIADEEHENSYKQDTYPYYDAINIAKMRCQQLNIPLVLGSATPSFVNYYHAQQGDFLYFYLDKRANHAATLPDISIVDMRQELINKNFSVLSHSLQQALQETLMAGKQAIILLNRRGFSTFVMCRDCGYIVKCTNCDVSLVYHKNNLNTLHCHYCGYSEHPPTICPKCSSHKIKFFGTGTQKLEEALVKDFADYKVLRMDQDTTRGKFGHDQILKEFSEGKPCILIGTQMVAKGHDFPNVTLVGILSADTGLNIPDYRAAENTFSLLTQMAGRAGRANLKGQVIIQTYNPEHDVMRFVQKHDYIGFVDKELSMRKLFNYPPYSQIMKIKISEKKQATVENTAQDLYNELNKIKKSDNFELLGPFFSIITRTNDLYHMYIICKGKNLSALKEYCYNNKIYLRKDISLQIDPTNSM